MGDEMARRFPDHKRIMFCFCFGCVQVRLEAKQPLSCRFDGSSK